MIARLDPIPLFPDDVPHPAALSAVDRTVDHDQKEKPMSMFEVLGHYAVMNARIDQLEAAERAEKARRAELVTVGITGLKMPRGEYEDLLAADERARAVSR